ncbi:non-SMC condensin II complex [Tieghemostelium lacteum]|uniref:Non-SMC condensin II complex n=1 Tax=Tieghemostelium lacteum TaxID=361077 RepID=A0A152A4Y3_TIELA|nr:non-SMC condensin II complex [Tieghemostelium lacteum]|eukprot:KYR01302.1 non-SMC condensin II complex [Tieghemostelium lacteum]
MAKNNNNNNNSKKVNSSGRISNSGLEVISQIGIQDISQNIINSIWRGEQLADIDKETMNTLTNQISYENLQSLLTELQKIPIEPLLTIMLGDTKPTQPPPPPKKTATRKSAAQKKKLNKKKKEEENEDEEMVDEKENDIEKVEELDAFIYQQDSNKFSEFIQESNISIQGMVVFFYWLIEHGNTNHHHTSQKSILEYKFTASSIYLQMVVLLRKAFHPFAYRSIMKLFSKKQLPSQQNSKTNNNNNNNNNNNVNKRKTEEISEDEEDEEDGMEVDNNKKPDIDNLERFWISQLMKLLKDFKWMLERFSLSAFFESYLDTVEGIIGLSRSHNLPKKPKIKGKNSFSLTPEETKLIQMSLDIMSLLISEKNIHGNYEVLVPPVLKDLIPTLTLNPGNGPLPSVLPKSLLYDRDNSIQFIKNEIVPNVESHDQIIVLLQHICVRFNTNSFPNFFVTFSKNIKSNFRLFSVEISLSLLQTEEVLKSDEVTPKLLSILVQRSSDKISTVRSKSLSCLSHLLSNELSLPHLKKHLKQVFHLDQQLKVKSSTNGNDDGDDMDSSDEENEKPTFISFLMKRSQDEKSLVRKSALQVLEVIASQNPTGVKRDILDILMKRTSDSSPLIRKQVISTLTTLLKNYPTNSNVIDYWRKVVLPLITDAEQTVVEKSLESINDIIFNQILTTKANNSNNSSTNIWIILHDISIDMTPYLGRVCYLMSQKKMITPQIIKAIQKAIVEFDSDQVAYGCWNLLSLIAYNCPDKIDQNLIISSWNKFKDSKSFQSASEAERVKMLSLLLNVLKVMEGICDILPLESAKSIFQEIYLKVKRFTSPSSLTQVYINILYKLTNTIHSGKAQNKSDQKLVVDQAIEEWSKTLLNICDQQLGLFIMPDKRQPQAPAPSEDMIVQYLFTIGELIQIPQVKLPSRLKTIVQALISPSLGFAKDQEDKVVEQKISVPVRAYAFITLGKLCLGDDKLAKRCIATFAKELEISDSEVIRNNVMVVMCDLCIRYTQLVDNYIPNIAMCLRDPSELVRKQTLISLTRLLQEDYVKWKGSLFFRFVESLVDPSPIVSEFSHYCLLNVIQLKYGGGGIQKDSNTNNNNNNNGGSAIGNIFYTHFLETIFVLNDCKAHSQFNQSVNNMVFNLNKHNSTAKNEKFSLKGEQNHEKRMKIYEIFLQNMDDAHKFQVMAKLCMDILSEIVDEKLPLQECHHVLYDTLSILACQDIKLNAMSKKMQEEEDDESQEAVAKVKAAEGKLLSRIVKKSVMENIVPIIIELKHLLESKRSPLLRKIIIYLQVLNKDFKEELTEIMAGNKELAKEIEYDLKSYNKKSLQSPMKKRVSLMPELLTPHNTAANNKVDQTPNAANIANFVVPSVRTPARKSIGGAINVSVAKSPPIKPFGSLSSKISITPSKLPQQQSPFTELLLKSRNMDNDIDNDSINNSIINSTPMKLNSKTPLRSAMRHSIGGAIDHRPSPTVKSIKFNLTLDDNSPSKVNSPKPKWNVNLPGETDPINDFTNNSDNDDDDDNVDEEDMRINKKSNQHKKSKLLHDNTVIDNEDDKENEMHVDNHVNKKVRTLRPSTPLTKLSKSNKQSK